MAPAGKRVRPRHRTPSRDSGSSRVDGSRYFRTSAVLQSSSAHRSRHSARFSPPVSPHVRLEPDLYASRGPSRPRRFRARRRLQLLLNDPKKYAAWRFSRTPVVTLAEHMSNLTCHNLSNRPLSIAESQVLGLGLNTVLVPPLRGTQPLDTALETLARSIRCRYFFRDSERNPSRWRQPNPDWQPPPASDSIEDLLASTTKRMHIAASQLSISRTHQLPSSHTAALKRLRADRSIVIKPADKNLGLTVLDSCAYKTECLRHLHDTETYVPAVFDVKRILRELATIIRELPPASLSKEVKRYFFAKPKGGYRPAWFYVIMKVHKTPPVGRPIAASHSTPTHHVSEWLDTAMHAIVQQQRSYIPDSLSMLKLVETLQLPPDTLLVTYDVVALYPSIPLDTAIRYIRQLLISRNYPQAEVIVPLLDWVMHNSFVEFDGITYRQIKGTAMGTPVAPAFATLFLSMHDETMDSHRFHRCARLHRRFLDDGAVFWVGTRPQLDCWLKAFNDVHPDIRITATVSSESIDFLDLTFYKGDRFRATGILDVRTFQKPMNKYLYLPFLSYHPVHCKRGFITSELKRYLLRSSSESTFAEMRQLFFGRLRARGYPTDFLTPLFASVPFHMRDSLLQATHADGSVAPGPFPPPHSTPCNSQSRPPTSVLSPSLECLSTPENSPLIFKALFEPLTCALRPSQYIRPLARTLHNLYPSLFSPQAITAWSLPQKIRHWLVRAKFSSPCAL